MSVDLRCEHTEDIHNVNFGSLRDINDNELVIYHCDKITHLDPTFISLMIKPDKLYIVSL